MEQLETAEEQLNDLHYLLHDIYKEVTESVFTEDENTEDLMSYIEQVEEKLELFEDRNKDAKVLEAFVTLAEKYLDKHKNSIEFLCSKYLELINTRCDEDAEMYKFELEEEY